MATAKCERDSNTTELNLDSLRACSKAASYHDEMNTTLRFYSARTFSLTARAAQADSILAHQELNALISLRVEHE